MKVGHRQAFFFKPFALSQGFFLLRICQKISLKFSIYAKHVDKHVFTLLNNNFILPIFA